MNEPLLEANAQNVQAEDSSLWNKAPAWRGLTMVASLLTLAAVATPLLLSQPVNTGLSPPAAPSDAAQIRNVDVTPSVAHLPPVPPAPAQTASVVHNTPQPTHRPAASVEHTPVAPPPQIASLPPQSVPAVMPDSGSAQPAADPSLANLPAGTIIVSPGVSARVNQHNRNYQGHDWPITITITSQPAHGTITTREAMAPITFANGVTRISQVTQVFYQSAPGYTGMDSFTYKRTSGDFTDPRNANTYTMTIDVKQQSRP